MTDPETFRGKRVVIIGGGDSAFDWATQLLERATRVTLVHRSDQFRAHAATVAQYMKAVEAGRADLFTFHELHDIKCVEIADVFTHVEIRDVKSKATRMVHADALIPMLGFVSDLGVRASWGLTLEKREIVVNSMMETAPGHLRGRRRDDVSGQVELIATGSPRPRRRQLAVHWIYPERKVAPGHSSNMELFGQRTTEARWTGGPPITRASGRTLQGRAESFG